MSHPVWVRGLKLIDLCLYRLTTYVAPCVGAWIETQQNLFRFAFEDVAPCVGAWIETTEVVSDNVHNKCRTLCGCVD